MGETPEQRYERLREIVEKTILQNFPNPERKGCPGDDVVREVAGRRELIEDDAWQHITHCSPCYATFLEYKDEFQAVRRRRGLGMVLGGIALVVLASAVAVYELARGSLRAPGQNENVRIAAVLDLKDTSAVRGAEGRSVSQSPRFLPRRKQDLTIYLPFGSEAGRYEVQLRRAGRELVTLGGEAEIKQGVTELRVGVDLSSYAPGEYSLAIRRPDFGWVESQVTLR